MENESVDEVFESFWKDIVFRGGEWDLEQVKKELADFRMVMKEVSLVYDSITGGRISKITTRHEVVIEAAERHFEELFGEDE